MDLAGELATVRAELARADGKASTLLSTAGTAGGIAAAAGAVAAGGLPALAQYAAGAAVLLLVAGIVALCLVVRPRLPRPGEGPGWIGYAASDPNTLATRTPAEHKEDQAAELAVLSRLVHRKYAVIRVAVDLLLAAVAVAAFTASALIVGGVG